MDDDSIRAATTTMQPQEEGVAFRNPDATVALRAEDIAKALGDPRDHAQMKILSGLRVSCWTTAE